MINRSSIFGTLTLLLALSSTSGQAIDEDAARAIFSDIDHCTQSPAIGVNDLKKSFEPGASYTTIYEGEASSAGRWRECNQVSGCKDWKYLSKQNMEEDVFWYNQRVRRIDFATNENGSISAYWRHIAMSRCDESHGECAGLSVKCDIGEKSTKPFAYEVLTPFDGEGIIYGGSVLGEYPSFRAKDISLIHFAQSCASIKMLAKRMVDENRQLWFEIEVALPVFRRVK